MNAMNAQTVVEVLGIFGDGKPYAREETYPMLSLLGKDYSPENTEKLVRRYLEYGLLRVRRDCAVKSHPYLQITDRGHLALDFYRDQHHKNPSKGVLF